VKFNSLLYGFGVEEGSFFLPDFPSSEVCLLRTRTLVLAVIVVLGACAPGPEADDVRVPAPEVAGHRERLADGSYVLGDTRELTVVTEGEQSLRWQSDRGDVVVRAEVALPSARRHLLRLQPDARVLEGVDAQHGTLRYRLQLAQQVIAPVIVQAEKLKAGGERAKAEVLLSGARGLSAADEARRSLMAAQLAFARGALEEARTLAWRAARQSAAAGLATRAAKSAQLVAFLEVQGFHAPAAAEAALAFAAQHLAGDTRQQVNQLYFEALAARERGDLRRALQQLEATERLAERLDIHPELDHAHSARASVLSLLGRHDEALAARRSLLTRVPLVDGCEATDLHGNVGWAALTALGGTAGGQRVGLIAEAERALKAAERTAQRCEDPMRSRNAHINLALLAILRKDLALARSELNRASQIGTDDALTAPWRLELEGRVALAEQRPDTASLAFERELALARGAADGEGTWRALVGLGRAHRAAGKLGPASDLFDEAERVLDRLAWGVPLGVGRGLFLDRSEESAAELIDSLLGQERCAAALAAARRALSRDESLAAASLTGSTHEPSQSARVKDLLERYQSARAALAREAEGDWALSAEKLPSVIASRATRIKASESLLDQALSLATRASLDRPLAAEPPRAGTLTLTFLPHQRELLGFAQLGTSCATQRMPAESTGDQLLAPFAGQIEVADRIELRTSGSLRARDLHTSEVAGAPLFVHAPVAYAISGSNDARRAGEERVLVIADPSDALPHARAEGKLVAESLAKSARVTTLHGAAATRFAVLSALSEATFAHFAGHGRLDGEGSLAPRLELADHGALSLGDVLGLPAAPRRVVLSACEAGTSLEPSQLARTLGLAQAFVARGAEQVVAPVRPVDDRASAALIAELYASYRQNGDLVLALRDAQLALADSPDSDWKSFRVWVR
jgi:CHAT domain-containing protein